MRTALIRPQMDFGRSFATVLVPFATRTVLSQLPKGFWPIILTLALIWLPKEFDQSFTRIAFIRPPWNFVKKMLETPWFLEMLLHSGKCRDHSEIPWCMGMLICSGECWVCSEIPWCMEMLIPTKNAGFVLKPHDVCKRSIIQANAGFVWKSHDVWKS